MSASRVKHLLAGLVAFLIVAGLAPRALAHEIQPTIADIAFENGVVRLMLNANAEAWIAEIDPGHDDTSEAPTRDAYTTLRALSADALKDEIVAFAPRLTNGFTVTSEGERLPFALKGSQVLPPGDGEFARISGVTLEAPLPPGARTVRVSMTPAFGELILRGTGDNLDYAEFLTNGTQSQEIPVTGSTQRGAWQVFTQYLGVGFAHILPLGLDHILFVIGLFLLNARMWPLLWQVSAFTLAHTVTLGLGAADIVRVPGSIVEPLIALSIVYVCVENVFSSTLHRWRPVLIFAFGLLHGLGFASVFEEYGIPDGQFFPALVAFNIGVEIGQLTVIAACFLAVGLWFRDKSWYRQAITIPASVVIALIGLYWTVTRIGLVPEFLPYV
ncbi:MAG: HupE/UreJ family protein [Pseudomonadota bacterium]